MYKNGKPFNGSFKGEFYFDGEKAEEKINYFSDGGTTAEISSKGLTIDNGNIKIGQWNFFHKDGSKKSRGRYDNNKKMVSGYIGIKVVIKKRQVFSMMI